MFIRLLTKLLLILCLFSIAGCFVRSIHPTYLVPSVIADFDKYNFWQPLSKEWTEIDEPLWEKRGRSMISYQSGKDADRLDVVFFKVGKGIYIDAVTDFQNSGDVTRAHLFPAHCLYRVTRKGDMFQAAPLNQKWLESVLAGNKNLLPHIILKDSYSKDLLVTATPEEWTKFLETYGDKPEAFEYNEAFHFKGITDSTRPDMKKDVSQQK